MHLKKKKIMKRGNMKSEEKIVFFIIVVRASMGVIQINTSEECGESVFVFEGWVI